VGIPYSEIGIGVAVFVGIWSFIVAETLKERAVIIGGPLAIFLIRSILPARAGGTAALVGWAVYGIGCVIFLRLTGMGVL
jgi:hypothetical protein